MPERDRQNSTCKSGQAHLDRQDKSRERMVRTGRQDKTIRAEQPGQWQPGQNSQNMEPEHDSQNMRARRGQKERDKKNGTKRTGQTEDGMQNTTGWTGLPVQNGHDQTVMTGLIEQASQGRTAGTGQRGQDCQDWIARTRRKSNFSVAVPIGGTRVTTGFVLHFRATT
jgi:hypothetical protein